MDQSQKEAEELLKPYLATVMQLEEADKLKSAQITALKLAIQTLKRQANDHKIKYEEELKKDVRVNGHKKSGKK